MQRYLKIVGTVVWSREEITKQDLLDVRSGVLLIDTKYGTYYQAEDNKWVPIAKVNVI